jgi:hypothetical protein
MRVLGVSGLGWQGQWFAHAFGLRSNVGFAHAFGLRSNVGFAHAFGLRSNDGGVFIPGGGDG